MRHANKYKTPHLHHDDDLIVEIDSTDEQHREVSCSHKHSFYSVFWIHEGIGNHIIDFCNYEIVANRIFFLRPEQVHLLCVDNQKIKYSTVQFCEDFYMLFAKNSDKNLPVFVDLESEDDINYFMQLWQRLMNEKLSSQSFKFNIIQGEIYMLLFRLMRIAEDNTKQLQQQPEIIEKYQYLVEHHFIEKHLVAQYAQMLGVSSNYLNVLVQKYLHCQASQLISNRIVLEIKRKLLDTSLSVSEICYMLGFNEVSYFSRYFKRQTGERPISFRNRMNKLYKK